MICLPQFKHAVYNYLYINIVPWDMEFQKIDEALQLRHMSVKESEINFYAIVCLIYSSGQQETSNNCITDRSQGQSTSNCLIPYIKGH